MNESGLRLLIAIVGAVALWWQARWLLRAYRRERDRQAPEDRSSRPFLASIALLVFAALATAVGIYTARRLALGAILLLTIIDAIRHRFFR